MTDLKQILTVLVKNDIEFVLVGGMAAVAHGSARLTRDIDIVYKRSANNIAAIIKAISRLNPYLRGAALVCHSGLRYMKSGRS